MNISKGFRMRVVVTTLGAALAMLLCGTAPARPAGSIDCVMRGMPVKDQTAVGRALIDTGARDSSAPVQQISQAGATCTKANQWTDDQLGHVIAWTSWKLSAQATQRKAHVSDADVSTMRAFIAEDPSREGRLVDLNASKIAPMIDELRQRGVRLHESGSVRDGEMYLLYLLGQMKIEEDKFGMS